MSPILHLMEDASHWVPVVSGRAALELTEKPGVLRMDFDFKGEGGFVVARQERSAGLPREFAVCLKLKGSGPVNHLEVKLADPSGKNVWRYVMKSLALPKRWRKIELMDHEFEFAWGPAGGGQIAATGAVEIAIVAAEGGSGSVVVGDLVIEDRSLRVAPKVTVSSGKRGLRADRHAVADWAPRKDGAGGEWIELEFEAPRFIGGLIVDWKDGAPSEGFTVRGTRSGRAWTTLWKAKRAGGPRSYIMFPGKAWRGLRLELHGAAAVKSLRWQHVEFSRSLEAFWHQIADSEPQGWHPCWLGRKQSLWTLVGTPEGQPCALINEQGMVEPAVGSFSVEPMLRVNGKLFTWADAEIDLSLREGWMPLPMVNWRGPDWWLEIEAFSVERGAVDVRYKLTNETGKPMQVQMLALLRPFQVNPTWQKFHQLGGVSKITALHWQDGRGKVNGGLCITPSAGAEFGALGFDEGLVVSRLAAGDMPGAKRVKDTFGGATGVLWWNQELSPGAVTELGWSSREKRAEVEDASALWRGKLREDRMVGAGWADQVARSALTAGCHVLLTRSGMALQPGARRYTRSWIRDGAVMSACLLRLGCEAEVRGYLEWYAPFQREDGFVPCCVDADGPDWLVEHDSHGQFIALVADHFRFAHDKGFTATLWPQVCKAAAYIERTLEMNRTAVEWTFNKYWMDWRRKRTGQLDWSNYTAYELRIIGAFVRLGQREKALELLQFFLKDQRPQPWNQWPEITWRDPAWPGHIGDVPQTWISAEFVLAIESLFAYENERQQALVLAAGLAPEWIEDEGVRVQAMATGFGKLSYRLQGQTEVTLRFEVDGALSLPAGGIILRPPLSGVIDWVTLNGLPHSDFSAHEIRFSDLPAHLLTHTQPADLS